MKQNVYFTTQPMEEPAKPMQLIDLFERIGWDRVLFSTDYPHWDFDDPRTSFRAPLTDAQRQQLLFGNARKVYERLG